MRRSTELGCWARNYIFPTLLQTANSVGLQLQYYSYIYRWLVCFTRLHFLHLHQNIFLHSYVCFHFITLHVVLMTTCNTSTHISIHVYVSCKRRIHATLYTNITSRYYNILTQHFRPLSPSYLLMWHGQGVHYVKNIWSGSAPQIYT